MEHEVEPLARIAPFPEDAFDDRRFTYLDDLDPRREGMKLLGILALEHAGFWTVIVWAISRVRWIPRSIRLILFAGCVYLAVLVFVERAMAVANETAGAFMNQALIRRTPDLKADARQQHDHAVQLVDSGQPFDLLLRPFSSEAHVENFESGWRIIRTPPPREVTDALSARSKVVPLIALRGIDDVTHAPTGPADTYILASQDQWKELVGRLLSMCSHVYLDLGDPLSESMEWELNEARRLLSRDSIVEIRSTS